MGRRYITADEFRARPLGISMRQYTDELLAEYSEIATAAVEGLCERRFDEAEYTEAVKGDGTSRLVLNNYPVTDIDSISGDYTESDLTRTDISDASGILELTSGTWAAGTVYTVTYTAGYADIPAPVKHATAVWMTELLKPDFAGPTLDVPEIVPFSTQQIIELLAPYRRRRIV